MPEDVSPLFTTGLMLIVVDRGHAKDVPLHGERFSASYRFKLLTPKFTEATEKSFFEKSDRVTENFQNFAKKRFTRILTHIFLPSFAEIGKAELTKRVHGIHQEKRLVFCPFCLWLLERSRQKCCRITLSPFPTHLPSFIQIRPVFEETSDNVFQKSVGFSPSKMQEYNKVLE